MSDATLVCLFRPAQGRAALSALTQAGVPASCVSVVEGPFAQGSLGEFDIPRRDLDHLREGVRNGGMVIVVQADAKQEETVERIFERYQAEDAPEAEAQPLAAVPVRKEALVDKPAMDRDSAYTYRRIIEIPVDHAALREERRSPDRLALEGEFVLEGEHTIELTETAEELVLGKRAQVVEEVHVSRTVTERTERMRDTVRRTEVEVKAFDRERSALDMQQQP